MDVCRSGALAWPWRLHHASNHKSRQTSPTKVQAPPSDALVAFVDQHTSTRGQPVVRWVWQTTYLHRNFKNINIKPVAEHQYQFPVVFFFLFPHLTKSLSNVARLTQVNSNGFSCCTSDTLHKQRGMTGAAQTERRRKLLDNCGRTNNWTTNSSEANRTKNDLLSFNELSQCAIKKKLRHCYCSPVLSFFLEVLRCSMHLQCARVFHNKTYKLSATIPCKNKGTT